MMRKTLPGLPHDDVAAGVVYYRDVLGFRINYQQDDLGVWGLRDFRVLDLEGNELRFGEAM